jgi:hypothetical protein
MAPRGDERKAGGAVPHSVGRIHAQDDPSGIELLRHLVLSAANSGCTVDIIAAYDISRKISTA